MNDEIKEIFDTKLYFDLEEEDYIKIKDYITNLEQANERLRNHIQTIPYLQTVREKEDYKSRVEKAVEYNKQIITDTKDFYRPTEDIIYSGNAIIDIATNNINILQNGSDDNG